MKVVVITGITGSVGRGIFLRLGREFFRLKVYGTARSYERASDAFRTLANRDPSLTRRIINGDVVLAPAILDTTDIATVRAFAKRLVEE
ncbi:hypothetical protein L0F63_004925 [Massospora cicadina]|nr:hypothetical protein L0F63_004925 [Massospora cicadina]